MGHGCSEMHHTLCSTPSTPYTLCSTPSTPSTLRLCTAPCTDHVWWSLQLLGRLNSLQ